MPMVFISHSSKDRTFVEERLVPLLRRLGIGTWYARDDIRTREEQRGPETRPR